MIPSSLPPFFVPILKSFGGLMAFSQSQPANAAPQPYVVIELLILP